MCFQVCHFFLAVVVVVVVVVVAAAAAAVVVVVLVCERAERARATTETAFRSFAFAV